MKVKKCRLCELVNGSEPENKIWEDKKFVAFLSVFPNTEGVTVIFPKKHYPSYHFNLSDNVLKELIIACKNVSKILDKKFKDVGRTALVLEGFGVDHAHAKLFPLHGTANKKWKPIKSKVNKYFNKYEGYISSHDSKKEEPNKLKRLAKKLRD